MINSLKISWLDKSLRCWKVKIFFSGKCLSMRCPILFHWKTTSPHSKNESFFEELIPRKNGRNPLNWVPSFQLLLRDKSNLGSITLCFVAYVYFNEKESQRQQQNKNLVLIQCKYLQDIFLFLRSPTMLLMFMNSIPHHQVLNRPLPRPFMFSTPVENPEQNSALKKELEMILLEVFLVSCSKRKFY